jgi:hypothetical protein
MLGATTGGTSYFLGNVGINTTSPSNTLSVNGTTNVTGTSYFSKTGYGGNGAIYYNGTALVIQVT